MKNSLLLAFILLVSFSYAQNDSAHYFTSFDNTRIYYEEHGTGYPVILIHGFLNTSQNWKRTNVYKVLADSGYRVIIADLRGNGKSDKPHTSEQYANDAEAKDVMLLASLLKLHSYDVIGYSRGSIITARLLVLDKRIQRAVLGGMGTDFTNPEWPRRKLFYHLMKGDTTVPEFASLLKRIETDTSLDRTALMYQQKEQPSTPVTALQKVHQPILVICGKQDSDNGNAKALALLFKKGRYAETPGDHGFAVTTKEFADEVLLFLKEGNSKKISKKPERN